MSLERSAPTPLYIQLKNALIAEINTGQHLPDQRLPSERDLCERFNVSRMTVRQALSEMEREDLIYSIVGKGTFVNSPKIDMQLRTLTGFSQELGSRGAKPASRVLVAKIIPASTQIAAVLKIIPGSEVVELSRLRMANGDPLCIETAYLPHFQCPGILKFDFSQESLYQVFEREYGLRLVRAEQTMEASLGNASELELLHLTAPAAVLRIERLTFSDQDALVEFVISVYRGDRYKFHSALQTKV